MRGPQRVGSGEPGGALREAASALGLIAAFVLGGLALAVLEREAVPARGYAPAEMAREREEAPGAAAEGEAEAAPALWLVDGFNVLCAGVLRGRERAAFWSEPNRRALLERVARFDDPGARLVVVFDGQAPAAAPDCAGPESVYAACADDWIVARVRERAGEPVAVVTADRQLAGRARHHGARVVAPLAFLARCRA
jgi:YacP-like NYN domain-containing protein